MNEEENIVVLTDDEGVDHEFEVLEIMELDDAQYAILLPILGEDEVEEEEEAIILKIETDENGEEYLCDIEDDEEWEMVAQAWQEGPNGDNGEAEV